QMKRIGTLQAACDIDAQKTAAFSEGYNCTAYNSLDDLLLHEKKIDVLAVCTPNGLHAVHTIAALHAGLHVVCEKPMAITSDDCKKMIAAAEQHNKKLFIVKQNRYNPPVAAVKKALDENRLGKIFNVQLNCFWNRDTAYYTNSWHGTKDLDGGTLFTQFSHFIDLLDLFFGDVKNVQAYTSNAAHKNIISFEDTGVVILEFEGGVLGSIHYTVNSYKKNMEGSLTIFGEKGTVKIGGEYLNELEYKNIENFEIKNLPAGNHANDYGTYKGSMSNHDKVYDNIADVLLRNAAVHTSMYDGLKTVEMIEKIYAAAIFISEYK
ncbi:MAG TPA: Gfo/Idh/MocA family oxidoreductase, partial [Chitinophagaceae bacterium]|nr:Gfo/Idh/MocA family oxidoreductase [Chitinophagaceae bacterium]